AEILHDLRHGLEAPADLARRASVALDHRQHLQRRDQPVSGGGEVRQDDVARLLAADIEAALAHRLADITVADISAEEAKVETAEITFEPEVGHDGGDDPVPREPSFVLPVARNHRHQLVAVDDAAFLVDEHDAIGVAIERDAEI